MYQNLTQGARSPGGKGGHENEPLGDGRGWGQDRGEGRGVTAMGPGLKRCATGCQRSGESAADLRITTNFSVSWSSSPF